MKNDHIIEFLDYYCALEIPPEYGVLIKGPWGSGKSFLINSYIEKQKSDIKFLNISLYGLSTISDVEAQFFQQLNPILSSKGAVLAGTIAKGLLKGTLKIDLDSDGKDDGSVSATVPDVKLSKFLTDTSNHILVFDDLERCEIPLNIILGFINHFVEKNGYKVSIIADEEKLIEEPDSVKHWSKIKEKLIGKILHAIGVVDVFFN